MTVTVMVLHDDGKSCSIFLPRGEGYTFRETGEPAPPARLRVAFSTESEPLWLHIEDLSLVDSFWDDLATAVEPSVLTALGTWPGLQPGVYLASGQGSPQGATDMEPHPAEADDVKWWVLLDGQVFSDDPFDSVTEAAQRLEERVTTAWLVSPEEGRHRWSLVRASRSWGYRNFVGT